MIAHPPFHSGELQVQRRAGVAAEAEHVGRMLSDRLPRGVEDFLAQQSFAVAATVDADGVPHASFLGGSPGFVSGRDEGDELALGRAALELDPDDGFLQRLETDPRVGLLFIDLETRRRVRVNGRGEIEDDELRVTIDEAYPNCPKFIRRRRLHPRASMAEGRTSSSGPRGVRTRLDEQDAALVDAADTLFVASAGPGPDGSLDVSHRGGPTGFVRRIDDVTLRIPDYTGNAMFNTLGNLALDPRAGLLVLDFEGGKALSLTGEVELLFDQEDPDRRSGGTARSWDFRVRSARDVRLPAHFAFEALDFSPHNP